MERLRREAAALGELNDPARMSLATAADRWWREKGQFLKSAPAVRRRLDRLVELMGAATPLLEITTPKVLEAIHARRARAFARSSAPSARRFLPANRTVNLDVIATLRPILRRARRAWGAQRLPEVDWAELKLPEPKPKPKEFTDDELSQLVAALPAHWTPFIRFAATYGCRLEEMFFRPEALDAHDPAAARVTLRTRKNDRDHVIPLLPADALDLAARARRAKTAELDTLWFRETARGRLHALTYAGAVAALRRGLTATGLRAAKGMKGAHDLRRHAAMRILRATGNLRVAQRLLGHASITSTLIYAHAVECDLREGLAAVSRNGPAASSKKAGEAVLDQRLN